WPRRELSVSREPFHPMTSPSTPPASAEPRVNLLNFTPAAAQSELASFLERNAEPKYRAAQIVRRLWLNPASSFDLMTELPKALRESLAASFDLPRLEIAARQKSSDGTEKFLFRLADGEAIESVAIPEGDRVGASGRRVVARGCGGGVGLPAAGGGGLAGAVRPGGPAGLRPTPPGVGSRGQGARWAFPTPADRDHERRVHGHGRAAHELE